MTQDFGKSDMSSCVQKFAYTPQQKMKYPVKNDQIIDWNKTYQGDE